MNLPSCSLAEGVYATCCGEDLVLLDVARDQYFCLPKAGGGVRRDARTGALAGLATELVMDLREAGLVVDRATAATRRWAAPAGREAAGLVSVRGYAPELPALLSASLAMFWRFRGQAFSALVDRQARRRGGRDDPDEAAWFGAAFQASLPWLPVQGACLYQSFLLLEVLRRNGVAADWVFGVRTWPFHAHCWVQAGDIVLNDTLDHVASFEPIMVI